MTAFKNSKFYKSETQNVTKLKTQNMTKLKILKHDNSKTKKKWQNYKTQNFFCHPTTFSVTTKNSNCDKIQMRCSLGSVLRSRDVLTGKLNIFICTYITFWGSTNKCNLIPSFGWMKLVVPLWDFIGVFWKYILKYMVHVGIVVGSIALFKLLRDSICTFVITFHWI